MDAHDLFNDVLITDRRADRGYHSEEEQEIHGLTQLDFMQNPAFVA